MSGPLLLRRRGRRGKDHGLDPVLHTLSLDDGEPFQLVLRREELPSLRELPFPVLIAHRESPTPHRIRGINGFAAGRAHRARGREPLKLSALITCRERL